ncbi:hypothetical protein WR25_06941 [Diploscapter pachys]|uniref:Fibronectin type-III domain-containing protein n=1 Tax=Diploscapter pachys TaxID=2018661 RepID=A0A2A2KB93_9BILA|nr:hypothetical protein WR25_06941 [Diploscapter pachys]
MQLMIFLLLFLSSITNSALSVIVAHFEPSAITDTSLVIRMVNTHNVSSFDMSVQIFDLDRLFEYRRTELKGSTKDQLFSFDGLTPNTWFAFRIHYHLHYEEPSSYSAVHSVDRTKQELVIKTKNSTRDDPSRIDSTVAIIDDLFVSRDNIYIGVSTAFKDSKKVMTVVVTELKCSKGDLKPMSQQITHHASFHFDLNLLGDTDKTCSKICVFPYVRVSIHNRTSETFRAKEWCGGLDEAKKLVVTASTLPISSLQNIALLIISLFISRNFIQ